MRIIFVFTFFLFLTINFTYAQNTNVAIANKALDEQPEPANSTVRGRVFYENTGRPVRRASIMLMPKDGSRSSDASGLTDNNGYFQIKNMKAGTYYAFINAPGVISPLAYANISKPRSEGFDGAVEGFQPIIVNGVSDIDVEIPAKQGGAINGRIMYSNGDTAIGVKVEILRKIENQFVPVIPNFSIIFSMFSGNSGFQTDDRGMYRFSGLPAGEYIVKVTENVSHSDSKRNQYDPFDSIFSGFSLLTMYYPDVFETEKAEIINIVPGQEQYDINIVIPDRALYRVEGKVISAKTKLPIAGAKITIKKVGDKSASIFDFERFQQGNSSNEQGFWEFKDLPKGTYKLFIEATERIPNESGASYPSNMVIMNAVNTVAYNQEYTERKYARRDYEITVEDKNLAEIIIELGFGATVSGTVEVEKSKIMPSITTIYAGNESDDLFLSDTVHNDNAEAEKQPKINHDFEIKNIPGGKTYFKFLVSDEDFYVKTATAGSKDLLINPIELGEGEILRNVKVVLGNDVGTIKGKVLDSNNQPSKQTELTFIPTDPVKRKISSFYRHVTTDEKGEFTVKAAPFEYAVVIVDKKIAGKQREEFYKWLEDILKTAEKVTVKAGETSTIKFLLPR